MVTYLVLGISLLVAALLIMRWYESANPSRLAKVLKWIFLCLGAAIAIFLGVTGRIQLAAIPLTLIFLPLILRSLRSGVSQSGTPSPGRQSEVQTAYLRMNLDHDSGEMHGTVLHGKYESSELNELSREELLSVLRECRANDEQSARLMESYLDHMYGENWREGTEEDGSRHRRRTSSTTMTRDEAYEVLGLVPGASEIEIREAHRKLQLKNHPDQGGSDYLAAKINQAKEVLLEGR